MARSSAWMRPGAATSPTCRSGHENAIAALMDELLDSNAFIRDREPALSLTARQPLMFPIVRPISFECRPAVFRVIERTARAKQP